MTVRYIAEESVGALHLYLSVEGACHRVVDEVLVDTSPIVAVDAAGAQDMVVGGQSVSADGAIARQEEVYYVVGYRHRLIVSMSKPLARAKRTSLALVWGSAGWMV